MILIHIKKENREPEVGEWYWDLGWIGKRGDYDGVYYECKSLSLSVILDTPEAMRISDFPIEYFAKSYPISNSEEIFQWLHDQGKLGEEWVEWEGDHKVRSYWGGKKDEVYLPVWPNKPNENPLKEQKCQNKDKCTYPAPLIRGVNPEYCGICGKDLESKTPFGQCLELLRQLADLQNGPPLETYRKEWDNTMTKIYDFLEKHEC